MTKRSLTQIGGNVEVWAGLQEFGELLTKALSVNDDEPSVMRHVHGFHSYPARMHPDTARSLVCGLCREQELVLDPFCGSGTVLVEARLQRRATFGIDANPLAVALARLKTQGFDAAERDLFLGAVDAICEHADARRCAKAGPSHRYPQHQREAFDPHVLLELDGLTQGIAQACPPKLKPSMQLVLSSMLNKVSRRRSDTNQSEFQRRLASGFTIHFFAKKARELLGRLLEYSEQLPKGGPSSNIELGDARSLPLRDATVSAIVTSPPYPGIYDYVEHHRLRLEWLRFDAKHLEQHEIGAHRHFARTNDQNASAEWAAQLGACLDEMARVLTANGVASLLIADSAVAGQAWYADRALQQLAAHHGLRVVGGASQLRQHYHAPTKDVFRMAPRREHLILLGRSATSAKLPTRGGAQSQSNPHDSRAQSQSNPHDSRAQSHSNPHDNRAQSQSSPRDNRGEPRRGGDGAPDRSGASKRR
ncbi:MAG: DNA methyltransferase [Myxococcales bacterium]